ncbi:alcohol dehydrogenase catalytic domain-containing protein [Nitrincola sp. MINF-07-Sa-05]|uniref:alcohol dehydrogenase catalytic domain-containing protein n=1 Tax=Nitrincola salilacus TaxID=3400273 RepID=UPI003917CFD2
MHRLMSGLIKPRISILGAEVAGTVEAIGSSVTRFSLGDRVYSDISNEYHFTQANTASQLDLIQALMAASEMLLTRCRLVIAVIDDIYTNIERRGT